MAEADGEAAAKSMRASHESVCRGGHAGSSEGDLIARTEKEKGSPLDP
jgi:hypothetical protein